MDLLTGVSTRHGFAELFRPLQRSFRNRREPAFAPLLIDLVDFKGRVNDRRGLDRGDEVLADFGRQLRAAVRESDLVARIGGDEFLVVARAVCNEKRLRQLMQRLRGPYRLQCGRRRVRLSAYAVGRVARPDNLDDLLQTIGRLLTRAKRAEKKRSLRHATIVHFPRKK